MKTIIIILFLLLTSNVHAGIRGFRSDEAMINWDKYELPFHETAIAARTWAHEIKYIPEIYRKLKHRMNNLRESTSKLDLSKQENIKQAQFLMGEWEFYNIALGIIEEYKKNGILGDPAQVGSTFYAGSIVVK